MAFAEAETGADGAGCAGAWLGTAESASITAPATEERRTAESDGLRERLAGDSAPVGISVDMGQGRVIGLRVHVTQKFADAKSFRKSRLESETGSGMSVSVQTKKAAGNK